MEAFLNGLLPRLIPAGHTFQIHPYPGKNALLRRIEARLLGYSSWIPDNYRIFVVVDLDNEDCKALKFRLEQCCRNVGLRSKRAASGTNWQVVTRIVIEELEAWYFGDWPAVCVAYPRLSPKIWNRSTYRNPDGIKGGTKEAFERVLQRHNYFKQGLAQKQAATEISKHVDPVRNRSHSFSVFRDAVAEAVGH